MALDDLTPKELEAIMDGKTPIPDAAEPAPPPAPAPEPEPVETAPEPTPEPVAGEPTNGVSDDEPPPPTTDELLLELKSRLEESDLRRERLEATLEHERLLRERANTKAGIYKSTAMDLLREDPRRDDSEDDGETPPEVRRLTREVAVLREEATTRAAQDTLTEFARNTPDLAADDEVSREILAEMQPHVRQGRQDYSNLYESGDPRLVRDTTRLILKAAYTEVKAKRLAQAREQASTRRIEQFSAARKAKLAAGSVQSAPAASAPPKQKALSEMTTAELAARLDEMVPPRKPHRL